MIKICKLLLANNVRYTQLNQTETWWFLLQEREGYLFLTFFWRNFRWYYLSGFACSHSSARRHYICSFVLRNGTWHTYTTYACKVCACVMLFPIQFLCLTSDLFSVVLMVSLFFFSELLMGSLKHWSCFMVEHLLVSTSEFVALSEILSLETCFHGYMVVALLYINLFMNCLV